MSFVVTAPELMTAAAGNLAGIGSTLEEATAAAAGPTTGVASAAADEVSVAVSQLFGTYAQEFQTVSGQAATFHNEFVSLLAGGGAAYLSADIANAEQSLLGQLPSAGVVSALANGGAASLLSDRIATGAQAASAAIAGTPALRGLETALLPGLFAPGAAAATGPGGAYRQLLANTGTNLESLFGTWSAHPFPLLNQIAANQRGYWLEIATALAGGIQNLPAELANLPQTIQAGVQGLLAFNAAFYVQQFITTQIGFAQTFVTNLDSAVTGIVDGLPNFVAGLQTALHAVRAGDYFGAVQDVAQAYANLLVTGLNPGNLTVDLLTPLVNPTVVATTSPTLLGPLGNLFAIANIPGQEAQYFTDLMPPSILRQMSQNFTNVLDALTIPSISTTATLPLLNPTAGSLSASFGLPLVLTYAVAGAPVATLNGVATSATAVQQALLAGDGLGAFNAFVDAPAVIANSFLNGEVLVDFTVPVPVNLPAPLPSFTVPIILHLPFDGILVPPHPVTATIDLNGFVPGLEIPATIFGTPFMGLVPLLVNYVPQQLAAAITPAA